LLLSCRGKIRLNADLARLGRHGNCFCIPESFAHVTLGRCSGGNHKSLDGAGWLAKLGVRFHAFQRCCVFVASIHPVLAAYSQVKKAIEAGSDEFLVDENGRMIRAITAPLRKRLGIEA